MTIFYGKVAHVPRLFALVIKGGLLRGSHVYDWPTLMISPAPVNFTIGALALDCGPAVPG